MYHHFDPPWKEREHHDPAGMVALCKHHHPEADVGTYTLDQLRGFKNTGRDRERDLKGRFNWMRRDLLAVVGGMFCFQVQTVVQLGDQRLLWFNRDEAGHMLLNLRVPRLPHEPPRLMIEDNDWLTEGIAEADIECQPSGKRIVARYGDGDSVRVEFREIDSVEAFDYRYPVQPIPPKVMPAFPDMTPPVVPPSSAGLERTATDFSITVVEVEMRFPRFQIDFGPRRTELATNIIQGGWMIRCQVGFQLG